jgi:hypothetical protein
MNRAEAKHAAQVIADDISKESIKTLQRGGFPRTEIRTVQGTQVEVEFDLLEDTSEYLNILVVVSGGRIGNFIPPSTNVVIRKQNPER